MPVLSNLFGMMSPIGSEFFEGYIHRKPQFIIIVDKFTEYYNEE